MNVVVFGANGKVGQLVVRELTVRDHTVRAFVHGEPAEKIAGVEYMPGDVRDAMAVSSAVDGMDAVISVLGSWGTKTKDILSTGMHCIVPAMEQRGIARIVSLTGADAWSEPDYAALARPFHHPLALSDGRPAVMRTSTHRLFSTLAPKIIQDSEAHIRLLAASSLNWTIVRSPVMNEKGGDGYHLSAVWPLPWTTINRRAVAQAICDQLISTQFSHALPYLHRG